MGSFPVFPYNILKGILKPYVNFTFTGRRDDSYETKTKTDPDKMPLLRPQCRAQECFLCT